MVDVQIRFSAEVLPFSFEPERKERLILDKPPQYYPLFDFWEEESQSEPQIHKEKHENDDDSNWEKPEPIEIHVDERNNIGTNDIEADEAMEEADAEFEFQNYLRQIDYEIALDKELEYNDYYDCDEYVKYEEDFEIAFFHSKKAHPKRIRNTSHYKKEKINPDRCINAYTQKREEQRIELIIQSHAFSKSNVFAKYGRLIPPPRVFNSGESTFVPPVNNNNNYTQYNRANNPNIPQSELDLINQAIQASLRTAQPSAAATNSLTAHQLLELQTRDLTPEDYELLLRLDESVKKKTLTKTQCASFPSRAVDEEFVKRLASNPCSICFGDYEQGEKVRTLPCNGDHTFHSECIDQWLTTSGISCPLCKASLEAFFE